MFSQHGSQNEPSETGNQECRLSPLNIDVLPNFIRANDILQWLMRFPGCCVAFLPFCLFELRHYSYHPTLFFFFFSEGGANLLVRYIFHSTFTFFSRPSLITLQLNLINNSFPKPAHSYLSFLGSMCNYLYLVTLSGITSQKALWSQISSVCSVTVY